MGGIFTEVEEEFIPAVEAVGHINDAGGYLAREIRELGGDPMNQQHVDEGLHDGLTKAAKFCGKVKDTRAVLYNGFSREHASLE
jgi:hypothetical protein